MSEINFATEGAWTVEQLRGALEALEQLYLTFVLLEEEHAAKRKGATDHVCALRVVGLRVLEHQLPQDQRLQVRSIQVPGRLSLHGLEGPTAQVRELVEALFAHDHRGTDPKLLVQKRLDQIANFGITPNQLAQLIEVQTAHARALVPLVATKRLALAH